MKDERGFQLVKDSEGSDDDINHSEDSAASNGPKGPDDPYRNMPVFCHLRCCCHTTYVCLFLLYMVMFPLWCKWLLTAPMPAMYWGQAYPDFPRMDLEKSEIALQPQEGPQIIISEIPHDDAGCNASCATELHGYRTGEFNFDVTVRLNKADLIGEVHSTYPVILTSQDFKQWMLVADRRNAMPKPLFVDVDDQEGLRYISKQDSCSKESLTEAGRYFIACVTWNKADFDSMAASASIEGADLATYCNALGGVCGNVGSKQSPTSLANCTAGASIQPSVLDQMLGGKASAGTVEIHACEGPLGTCVQSVNSVPGWRTHKCEIRSADADARRLLQDIGLPPGISGAPGGGVPGFSDAGAGGEEEEEEEETTTTGSQYTSLPRIMVSYYNVTMPADAMSHPKVYILSSTSIAGPWSMIYTPVDPDAKTLPPIVAGTTGPLIVLKTPEDEVRMMELDMTNELTLTPVSCFGKHGPLYIVACAINQSSYDDSGAWKNSKDARFALGQHVMPPPFNDRCVAVAGRCGQACTHDTTRPAHCDENGYIMQEMLVGPIPIQYNRETPVFLFAYVLLFGFAVKTVMLCPGIFSPYPRCNYYSSELTEQLKYVLVVGVTGGGDEGKGTMIRNTIGMVSGLPPDCKCHYVICNNEEGHRLEMMYCWEKFCAIISSMPQTGPEGFEGNLRKFFRLWVEDTKNMRLGEVGGKVKQLDPGLLSRLSGKTTLDKIKKQYSWGSFGAALDKLQVAIDALHEDLSTNYNKFTPMTPQLDFVRDWIPPDRKMTSLRMHFTSRAKPMEDERNIMVQHVAVGTWYYKVPEDAHASQWLELRQDPREMIYSQADDDSDGRRKVPLRSSHGKAGGLNFVDNYISICYDHRPENLYPNPLDEDEVNQNEQPSLYAIADARHQFQPDFMISCIPCFFDVDGLLNKRVAFTQAPQHYPEYSDKADYLDNNNAQFFRLNAMIRNCCGGVSSCGTNGMWQIPGDRAKDTIWQERKKRVRDRDAVLRTEKIEREQFHTSCKIEDTASSLDRVLVGEYSHFVNRKLSYGMSKDPEGFLGAQQRWVEGAITLCMQWTSNNADAHGKAARNQPLLWCVIIAFILYVWSLCRLVTKEYTSSVFVEVGLVNASDFHEYIREPLAPGIHFMYERLLEMRGGHTPNSYSYEVYEDMTMQFIVFLVSCLFMFFLLWLFTNFCRCFKTCINLPYEMKWWARLLISFDNLTYWVWFWTSFFWLGFNVYLAVLPAQFHFHNVGMMSFMLVATLLNYALIISNSLRFQVMESIDANEIAFLSMDNIWRANQLFFIVGPIQGFSVITGTKNFLNYLFYGQDIGGWAGGDLTQVSIAIVKYWTTMIICSSIGCWIYLFYSNPTGDEFQSRRPGCIVFSFIAMDVLHPCVYLWTVSNKLSDEEVSKMTIMTRLTSSKWWKKQMATALLNETTTNIFRYVAPVYNFCLPFLVFYNSYFGVGAGFTMVQVGAGH